MPAPCLLIRTLEDIVATINDLVLVHIDEKPAFFARIETIEPDVKPGWWQVTFLALMLPLQVNTWILDTSQVEGAPFTMGGTPVRLEKVVSPVSQSATADKVGSPEGKPPSAGGGGKVVPLSRRKKS
jgi:hypothetical protein